MPALFDKGLGVITFIGSYRNRVVAGYLLKHSYCCLSFACSSSLGDGGIDHQTIAILHQDMAREGKLGFFPLSLLGKESFRIGC